MPVDPAVQAHLQTLKTMMGGMNPQGGPPLSVQERLHAGEQYMDLLRKQESAEAWHMNHDLAKDKQGHDQGMEERRHELEQDKARAAALNEARRLDIEEQRVEVQKAEVIIRALEVAARNPEVAQLMGVVREMSTRLLGGQALPALAIEDKEK